ncbi:LuxR C-terminal-related transcriptional regulator [Aliarcobacter vitoriensis]|uniref:Helix-turn-helix transcriptional regulator n=1 Tax=Aliarcobacter vitoriensis TaxID=2011099 RepID=A0A366MTA3_9BACT|nr:LuxR C-terminal-related transcriptional regulator [Aliarcobacter vitoriensis]RBQ28729.1 helix-turn-helix transcriptional regulator [Aliarcobacter vitoriensis]
MKIKLFSSDIALITRWEKLLEDYEFSILNSEEELLYIENSIVVLSSCIKISNKIQKIKKLKSNNNKIIILEREPNILNAKRYFDLGIDGYGNSLMSSSFFKSAIESVENNYIWVLPNITQSLIRDIAQIKYSKIDDNVLNKLTISEKKVAEFLKVGYKNQEIGDELSISINTVKKHIKNIYNKLDVHDRISFTKLFI